jgi:hypothetical protein
MSSIPQELIFPAMGRLRSSYLVVTVRGWARRCGRFLAFVVSQARQQTRRTGRSGGRSSTSWIVAELVEAESVPFLPVLRYRPSGLRKREIWEHTWELQRREDVIDAEVESTLTRRADETPAQFQERLATEQRRRKREEVGDISPPPKYASADFQTSTYWRLRGALDVPKERFVSYPFCSRHPDASLLIGWAGWDHLQQAKALAAWYTEVAAQEGWTVERLKPLLAGLAEIIPWLKQWHNDLDPEFQERMGDFFATFLQGQLQLYSLTRDDLKHWTPPASGRPRRSRRRS